MLQERKAVVFAEDWFNTYLDYLQYVSWCTNVWFMFMHIDVTIEYMTFLPSNWMGTVQLF